MAFNSFHFKFTYARLSENIKIFNSEIFTIYSNFLIAHCHEGHTNTVEFSLTSIIPIKTLNFWIQLLLVGTHCTVEYADQSDYCLHTMLLYRKATNFCMRFIYANYASQAPVKFVLHKFLLRHTLLYIKNARTHK